MCLNDEMKKPESIEAHTYNRLEKRLERWRLALKMRRWEKNNQVTVYDSGVSSSHQPITNEEKLKRAQQGRGEYNRTRTAREMYKSGEGMVLPDNGVKRSKAKAKSGYQNLRENKDGTYTATVGGRWIATAPLEEALMRRDRYREAVGLARAVDNV